MPAAVWYRPERAALDPGSPPRGHAPCRWFAPPRGLIVVVAFLALAACSISTPMLQGPEELPPSATEAPLKVHLHSGELVLLETWEEEIEGRRLVGYGRRFDPDRLRTGVGRVEIPVDSVALVELTRTAPGGGQAIGLTLLAGYTVLSTAYTIGCLLDPKACFGSCPTFYLDDGAGGERLAAEGFSSSVTRSLEATDVDDLRVTASSGMFSLRMRNEALETHVVRSLRVLAVPEPASGRVFHTLDGRFRTGERVLPPESCVAAEGDCLDAVRALDGQERASPTDPEDLAARETIELTFRPEGIRADPEATLGLVLAARHTFVSTFLFYQMLDDLGPDAGAFLAELERGDEALLAQVRSALAFPARFEVEVEDADGVWRRIGALDEAGPLAADVHLLELPSWVGREDPVRVRIGLTQGFWRIEHVGLAELGEEVEARVLTPVALERLDGGPGAGADAAETLAALLDPDRYLVTESGDHYRITFASTEGSGDDPDAHARLFLESTGHYYEWMRAEWMAGAAPERVARMLLQPRVVLRELAPAFKEREARMEEAFWNSRFRR